MGDQQSRIYANRFARRGFVTCADCRGYGDQIRQSKSNSCRHSHLAQEIEPILYELRWS